MIATLGSLSAHKEVNAMKDRQYKDLSIKEFTRAASVYDSGHAGIYELCKDDYPPILSELEKMIGVPVKALSVSPDRKDVLFR
jgi:hypothetical protein